MMSFRALFWTAVLLLAMWKAGGPIDLLLIVLETIKALVILVPVMFILGLKWLLSGDG